MPDSSFHEVRFPTGIGFGSSGGPFFKTEVIELDSGHERRNIQWEYPLEAWNVAYGVKTEEQLQELLTFFYARRGMAYGFRFKNPIDHVGEEEVCNYLVQAGAYQMFKHYVSGPASLSRKIVKPVEDTVRVFVDGTEAESGWTVDETTGLITFTSSPYPDVVTASFEFDIPVRFGQDGIELSLDNYKAGAAQVPLKELKR